MTQTISETLPNDSTLLHEIGICCQALDDKKAEDIRVLDVRGKSNVTDFFIIATGTSQPHLRALRSNVEGALREHKIRVIAADLTADSGWMVLDGYDFMVHVFTLEMREAYALENLWKDAKLVKWQTLVSAKTETKN